VIVRHNVGRLDERVIGVRGVDGERGRGERIEGAVRDSLHFVPCALQLCEDKKEDEYKQKSSQEGEQVNERGWRDLMCAARLLPMVGS
jgi:hypothetical protein